MALHPLFADILRTMFPGTASVASPTPAPRREPTEAGEPDTRTIEEVCDSTLAIAKRIKEEP